MSTNRPNPDSRQPDRRKIRDIPGCIKYIILLFLLLLLFAEIYAGEFKGFPRVSQWVWFILFFKFLLILLILILIWVQRQLTCSITAPLDCAHEEYDAEGDPFLKVIGSVGGAVFGHYIIEVGDSTTSVLPNVVSYPGGGASGTSPVSNGELGTIDTSEFDGGMYTIRLRVFSTSGAEKSPPCQHDFSYMRFTVFVRAVGNIPVTDTGAYSGGSPYKIKLIKDGANEKSEGGGTLVQGGAYVHGCGKRTIQYKLQYQASNPGPAEPVSLTTPLGWIDIQPALDFGTAAFPYYWNCFADQETNYVTNAELTRFWSTDDCGIIPKPKTLANSWGTAGLALNGRYTVRLIERHAPSGGSPVEEIIDGATVWLDNRTIIGKVRNLRVTGVTIPLAACDELRLTQFQPSGNADIIGQAWDPLIIDGLTDVPSENFGSYNLTLKKDGGPSIPVPDPPLTAEYQAITGNIGTPVPTIRQVAAPAPADTDVLFVWNIVAFLDAGNLPPGASLDTPAPYPKLYRGQRCAFIIRLYVEDKSAMDSTSTPNRKWDDFPFCIMNDIPPDPEL